MPIQTLEPRRLYRQIAEQLAVLIRAGEFAVGSRLPPERDLAQQFGVSRPSLREALIALEVQGLVEVRMGSGIYVVAREPAASAPRVDNAFGPFEIIRARQMVEGELAAGAAHDMVPSQVEGLREALEQMASDITRNVLPLAGDRLFHLRIAEAADNGPLLRTVSELINERNSPLFEQLGQHFESVQSWSMALDEHRAIVAAIAAGDADAARAAMRHHLQCSHDRYADVWPPAATVAAGDTMPR